MHPRAVEAITTKVSAIAEELQGVDPESKGWKKILGSATPASSVVLTTEGKEKLIALVEELTEKHKWSTKFSAEYIKNRIVAILFIVAETVKTDAIHSEVQKLVADFESFNEARTGSSGVRCEP
jgi:hypothetical protein